MLEIVEMIDTVLAHPEDGNIIKAVREKVNQTMKSYPIPSLINSLINKNAKEENN